MVMFLEVFELFFWVFDILFWDGVEVGWVDWYFMLEMCVDFECDVVVWVVGVVVIWVQVYVSVFGFDEVMFFEIVDVGLIFFGFLVLGVLLMKVCDVVVFVVEFGFVMEYELEEIIVFVIVEV